MIVIFTDQTLVVRFLLLATSQVGHAVTVSWEEVRSAMRAEAVGVDKTLRVSQLTFSIVVEEVQSITVDADS